MCRLLSSPPPPPGGGAGQAQRGVALPPRVDRTQQGLWALPQPAKRQPWVGAGEQACTKPFWTTQIVDLADFYQDGLYLEDIVQMNQI